MPRERLSPLWTLSFFALKRQGGKGLGKGGKGLGKGGVKRHCNDVVGNHLKTCGFKMFHDFFHSIKVASNNLGLDRLA